MKIAFATQDMKRVDAHFAGARNLAIFAVSPEAARFVKVVQFDRDDGGIDAKIEAVEDCAILCVAAIGGPAAARVVNTGIHPIKIRGAELIDDVLDRLRDVLRGTPPPWLRKALRQGEERDFSFLEEDDDDD